MRRLPPTSLNSRDLPAPLVLRPAPSNRFVPIDRPPHLKPAIGRADGLPVAAPRYVLNASWFPDTLVFIDCDSHTGSFSAERHGTVWPDSYSRFKRRQERR